MSAMLQPRSVRVERCPLAISEADDAAATSSATSLTEALAICDPALERLGVPERKALRECCRDGRAMVDAAFTDLHLTLECRVYGIPMTRAGLKAVVGMVSRGCSPRALLLTLSEVTQPDAFTLLEEALQHCGASAVRLQLTGPLAIGSAVRLVEVLAAAMPSLRELRMDCTMTYAAAHGLSGVAGHEGPSCSVGPGQAATEHGSERNGRSSPQRWASDVLAIAASQRQLRSLELPCLRSTSYDEMCMLAAQHPHLTSLAVHNVWWHDALPATHERTGGAAAADGGIYPPNTPAVALPPRLRLLRFETERALLLRHVAALAPPGADARDPAPAGGRLSLQSGRPLGRGEAALLRVYLVEFALGLGLDETTYQHTLARLDPQHMARLVRALVWLLADQMAPRATSGSGGGGGGAALGSSAALHAAGGSDSGAAAVAAGSARAQPHTGIAFQASLFGRFGDSCLHAPWLISELAPIGCLGGGLQRLEFCDLHFDTVDLRTLASTCPSLKGLHFNDCAFAATDVRELVPLRYLELLHIHYNMLDLWLEEEGAEEGLTRLAVEGGSAVARNTERVLHLQLRDDSFTRRMEYDLDIMLDMYFPIPGDQVEFVINRVFKSTRWGSTGQQAVLDLCQRLQTAALQAGRALRTRVTT